MILDTCALLWLARGGEGLSEDAARAIDEAPVVYVSAITGFEIGLKYRSGKLELPALPLEWLGAIVEHHGLSVLPLDLPICVRATELPAVHTDPCDRLIIATAQIHGLPVVTADPVYSQYGVEVIG